MSNTSISPSYSPPNNGSSLGSSHPPPPPPPLSPPSPPTVNQGPPSPEIVSSPPNNSPAISTLLSPPPSNSTEADSSQPDSSTAALPPSHSIPSAPGPSNSPSNSSRLDAATPPSSNSSSASQSQAIHVPPPPFSPNLPSSPPVPSSQNFSSTSPPTTGTAPVTVTSPPSGPLASPQSPFKPAETPPANPENSLITSPPPPSVTSLSSPSTPVPTSIPSVKPSIPSSSEELTSRTQNSSPKAGHSSTHSSYGSTGSSASKTTSSSDDNISGATVGIVLSVIAIAFAAFFFIIVRNKRRKRSEAFMNHYRPPPNSFSVKSDGYYSRSGPQRGSSVHSDLYSSGPHSSILNGHDGPHSGLVDSNAIGNSRSCFSYDELIDITNGFSHENKIGEGGFGSVYKGHLPDGREVAVKQLKAGSGQGEREFRAEVEIISRVHHRHLVSLVGYCIAEHQRLLVYEFVPNGTLEHHLHGRGQTVMEWTKRIKIAIGSAKGLAYLHEDCHPRIIHRDIKSANILLDNYFEAQVADFGLAKLSNDTNTHISTRVMGTFGYMAPEYASSGKLTDKSDVFSFGVVLLELLTGRKPVDATQPLGEESLVEWARPLLVQAIETGNLHELVDPRLENNYDRSEMHRMIEAAAACVRHSALKRPRMMQVVRALDSAGEMADLTNGVKFGQSTIFQSSQYPNSELQRFQQMAFASGEYSDEFNYSNDTLRSSSHSGGSQAPHQLVASWRSENSSANHQSSHDFQNHPRSGLGSLQYNFK